MRKKVAEVEEERERLEGVLEKAHNREEELKNLDEAEKEMRERIELAENNLENMTPKKRRELYQDLYLRVEVGADKRPLITGLFPKGRTEDGTHKLYVSRLDTSQRRVGSLTGPIDPLMRTVGSGACSERAA